MLNDQDIYDELPFSIDEGWAEMQALLNKKLPVKKNTVTVSALLPAFLLFVIFLFSSLQISKDVLPVQLAVNELHASSSVVNVSSFVTGDKKYQGINKYKNSIVIAKSKIEDENKSETGNELNLAATFDGKERVYIENIVQYSHENKNRRSVIKIAPANTLSNFPMTIVAGKRNKSVKPWELSAGIGVNMAAGKYQNLQPYPVAEIKYNLNKDLFVAAGLSLFSPAPANVSGVSKTTYVNDTSNNIRLYNEVAKYESLRYADVPLFVGVSINKKITLQAGLQTSFLLSKSQSRSLQQFDFQMNNIDRTDNLPLVGFAANPHEEFNVQVKNIDYRFIAGIKYQYNKISAGLFYQHGLQSTGKGNVNAKSRNQLFTLNLLYKIR